MKKYMLVFLLCWWGCSSIPDANNKIDYKHIPYVSNESDCKIESLALDTIFISSENENDMTSLDGVYFMKKDTICFADRQLASVFCYDTSGKFLRTHLSLGRGPNEIFGLYSITPSEEGYIIVDASWNTFVIDSNWKKKLSSRIDWNTDKSDKYLLNHPDPNENGIYEYEFSSKSMDWWKGRLLIPIVTEHVTYNAYGQGRSKHFYEHSYTIGMLQGNDFKLVRMICPRSPVYLEYEYLSGFKGVLFTVCDDSLFFSFEADSKIYRMDLNDEKVVAFGCAGEDMNTDYPERKSLEESDEYLWEDHQKYGHYYDLKYIPETSVLFRSFRHGGSCKEDGLQVYKNTCLVAEYKVPKEFKVIGYFPPYYYAAGETGDEEDERMVIYRFSLF